MNPKHRPPSPLSPQERAVVDLIAGEYRPDPMSPVRQAAFRRRLSEHLVHRTRARWAAGFGTAAATAAAAVLLLVMRASPPLNEQDTLAQLADAPMLYAYVDPDQYTADTMRSYLPGEYRLIADALDEESERPQP